MVKCAICGQEIDHNMPSNISVPICDDCIARFDYNNKHKGGICLVCGREVPVDKRHICYCSTEHRRFGDIIRKRLANMRRQGGADAEIHFGIARYRRMVNRKQKPIDDLAKRAKANGISAGMQRALEMGLVDERQARVRKEGT